ncbi:type II toxin-antitoxin system VapC family toxin [Gloeobacter violaceus]|uniref:Ribonuclease VapC n=1 Tax=Gloeobacter violaceus (strain ATCC 29082 / PCC 7421) TaxID=251221 RepID=Q7NCS9_GLOVI|nr:PIN domain-containing protein [Gloeobacter violaceus]BAC90840.1 gll2899 [Gloeobacter violaceus PCC 7421]
MFLVDTSVWVSILRDRTGMARECFERVVGDEPVFLSRFTQMELLQGCRDQREWVLLQTHLQEQDYAELSEYAWTQAARIYYDLRRRGLTVRSSIDCCIAQLAIERRLALVHSDRDFEAIQQVRALSCVRFSCI